MLRTSSFQFWKRKVSQWSPSIIPRCTLSPSHFLRLRVGERLCYRCCFAERLCLARSRAASQLHSLSDRHKSEQTTPHWTAHHNTLCPEIFNGQKMKFTRWSQLGRCATYSFWSHAYLRPQYKTKCLRELTVNVCSFRMFKVKCH